MAHHSDVMVAMIQTCWGFAVVVGYKLLVFDNSRKEKMASAYEETERYRRSVTTTNRVHIRS